MHRSVFKASKVEYYMKDKKFVVLGLYCKRTSQCLYVGSAVFLQAWKERNPLAKTVKVKVLAQCGDINRMKYEEMKKKASLRPLFVRAEEAAQGLQDFQVNAFRKQQMREEMTQTPLEERRQARKTLLKEERKLEGQRKPGAGRSARTDLDIERIARLKEEEKMSFLGISKLLAEEGVQVSANTLRRHYINYTPWETEN